ncbi:MAG: hypothetical protein KF817_14985 [Phycisphaeraceae bacterium]|nr:hypothetical protein [Phycisphaeraceae bacterium]
MPTIYPDQVRAVLKACLAYQDGNVDLDELKARIWEGAQAVVAVEEAEFRRFLQSAEGKLDVIQFTAEDVRDSALDVVRKIEARVRAHLA